MNQMQSLIESIDLRYTSSESEHPPLRPTRAAPNFISGTLTEIACNVSRRYKYRLELQTSIDPERLAQRRDGTFSKPQSSFFT